MKVIEYIKEHGLEALTENFGIKVKKYPEQGIMLLDYDQIESPKTNPITIECRSLILSDDLNVVSRSFDRFFNLGEALEVQPQIDWKKASIATKVDGSLIKIYRHNFTWYVSTRGTAFADSQVGDFGLTFKELVLTALNIDSEYDFQKRCNENLNPDNTYIFEITSMENRVVTRYEGYTLHYLGARENETGDYVSGYEFDYALDFGAVAIKHYSFGSAEECIEAAKNLPNLEEGYVVYQNGIPVAKIKSPQYLIVHAIRGNNLTTNAIAELVALQEQDEYLAYYPEDKHHFVPYEEAFQRLVHEVELTYNLYKDIEDQKQFAMKVKNFAFSAVLFQARKQKENPVHVLHQQRIQYRIDLIRKFVEEV